MTPMTHTPWAVFIRKWEIFSPHLLVWVGHACVKIMIYVVKMTILHTTAVAQSICTHYSKLSGQPYIFLGSGTLKKSGPKKSRMPKNRVIVIQKENRQPGLFSFGITMTLIFCTLFFLDLIFLRVTNRPMFSKQE